MNKSSYEAIGFLKLLDGDVAILGIGKSGFILQNRFEQQGAET